MRPISGRLRARFAHGVAGAFVLTLLACGPSHPEGAKRVKVENHPGTPPVVRARLTQQRIDGSWVNHGPAEFFSTSGKRVQAGSYNRGLESGEWIHHTDDGMTGRGRYVEGHRQGEWIWMHSTGKEAERGHYAAGKRHGLWRHQREDGSLSMTVTWSHGARHGVQAVYRHDGTVLRRTTYVEGEPVD